MLAIENWKYRSMLDARFLKCKTTPDSNFFHCITPCSNVLLKLSTLSGETNLKPFKLQCEKK